MRLWIQPSDALASVGIFEESLPVPDQLPDVELVVEDADAALRVPSPS